jgi:hypothetical protein
MTQPTADLHWVHSDRVAAVIDGKAVRQDKSVRMRADWRLDCASPKCFFIHEESFFLARLVRRLGGSWHPMASFRAYDAAPGMSLSVDVWETGTRNVPGQSRYFFTDDAYNASGVLTVSSATHYVSKTQVESGGRMVAVVPGVTEIGIRAAAGGATIVHGIGATEDPRLRVTLMVPWGQGDADLLGHLRHRLSSPRVELGNKEPTDSDLRQASQGFLSADPGPWVPNLRDGMEEITVDVDEERGVEVRVDLVFPKALSTRTAYALRVTDTADPDNFVVSDVVLIDGEEDMVRIWT